ncbi:Com family DNA-binding transcriptional regulator [uncultured Herbaspirillum sp.]|uniref:Com family DNA-binding transcriptional regulator n=1 Tax=uncultured Herbaspirillum sp. TaxID=160236 RepID=UPI00262F564F|nr:Com family DNA-binding transcriptional regulator [uncultured Herbaspirillum sp.]
MEEIRCGKCNKKLADGLYIRLNIKCPRCGTLNHLSAKSAATERHGASNKKESLREQVPDP